MKIIFSIMFATTALLISCKKDTGSNQPFSTWKIGADSFSTNNLEYYNSDKAGSSITWNAQGSSAGYYTILTRLPENGKRLLYTGSTGANPDYLDLSFSKENIGYVAKDSLAHVIISRPNGVFTLEMPPTIFVNEKSSSMIVVSATLRYNQ